jgi:predicted HD superfamily hydrolase involved in NAD metabolism
MDLNQYVSILESRFSSGLLRHSLGVADTAADLAGIYRVNKGKAFLAGLLHDYAKELEPELLLKLANQFKLPVDPITWVEGRKLLHAPVGAALVAAELGITDPEILSAISCHTTGKAEMSILDKVVYLADVIEPNRDYDGVERLRALSRLRLDQAALAAVNMNIYSVLKRDLMLHPGSVDLRNDLIARIRDQEKYTERC